MKKRLSIRIALAIVGVAVLVGILTARHNSGISSYQGKAIQAWAMQLNAPDRDEAGVAFKAMGSNAVPCLVKLLQSRDSQWRKRIWPIALRLRSRIRPATPPKTRPPEAAEIRAAAARALGVVGPDAKTAVPALVQVLADKDPQVFVNAAKALGQIGAYSVPNLVKALRDQSPNMRRAAAYALGEVGPEAQAAAPDLIQALKDPDANVRTAAIYGLAKIGSVTVPLLVEAIERERGLTRQGAARALASLHPRRQDVAPTLLEMLRDDDPVSREQALQTLAELGAPDNATIQVFIGALEDPAAEVRSASAKALARLGWGRKAQPAVPALTRCLADGSPLVREWSARALGNIGEPAKPAVPELTRLLQDPEPVHSAAKQALDNIH